MNRDPNATEGAIDIRECPRGGGNSCRCDLCAQCGFRKHTAVHGPVMDGKPGGKPYGHKFTPRKK